MRDYSKYIGIPYLRNGRDVTDSGLDCWGLLRIVLSEQWDIHLPRLEKLRVVDERAEMLDQITAYNLYDLATPVAFSDRQEGDIAVFEIAGEPIHVSLILDRRYMIHAHHKCGCAVEDYTSPRWNRRLEGVYRLK